MAGLKIGKVANFHLMEMERARHHLCCAVPPFTLQENKRLMSTCNDLVIDFIYNEWILIILVFRAFVVERSRLLLGSPLPSIHPVTLLTKTSDEQTRNCLFSFANNNQTRVTCLIAATSWTIDRKDIINDIKAKYITRSNNISIYIIA